MNKFWKRNKTSAVDQGEVVVNEVTVNEVKQDRFLPVSILIAAVVIGGSIMFSTLYHPAAVAPATVGNNGANNGGNNGATPGETATTLTTSQIMKLGSRDGVLGSPNAPVTLIEYGDYQCPFCGSFFSQTEPQIIQSYVNTGKVKMVFRNFPFLGPESTAAAEASECAQTQNKAWPYHDALYQAKVNDVAKGGGENDGFFKRSVFLSIAQQLNLNLPAFTQCIDNHTESSTVSADVANANAAGINSTPTFYINGTQVLGADPFGTFQQVIDSALKA
jgi:protein-disulfide isomerase